jgi:hypothetical protein
MQTAADAAAAGCSGYNKLWQSSWPNLFVLLALHADDIPGVAASVQLCRQDAKSMQSQCHILDLLQRAIEPAGSPAHHG